MTTSIKFAAALLAALAATTSTAIAGGGPTPLPEPGSLALVGLAIGAIVVARRRK
jgi:hypothetical protein